MPHCSLCRRAGRLLIFEGGCANACALCVIATADFVARSADATVREIWHVSAPIPTSPALHVAPEPLEDEILEDVQLDILQVLERFRAGVAETVPDDDAQTHLALGIAYREMGLHDDAAREFGIASKGVPPLRDAEIDSLGALALLEGGRHFEAIRAAAAFIVAQREATTTGAAILLGPLPASSVSALRERLFTD